MNAALLTVEVDGQVRRLRLERRGEGYTAELDGREDAVDLRELLPGVLSVLIEGRAYRCVRTAFLDEQTIAVKEREHRVLATDQRSLRAQRGRPGAGNGSLQIKASMPGRVARVLVTPGDAVVAQQGIVVIEAMKMQNELKAQREGRVTEVRVAAGDTVSAGQVLAVLE